MKLSPRFSRLARQWFFFIHLWSGIILGLWFVAIGLSGSVLAWPELMGVEVRWRFPNPTPPAGTPQISVGQAIAAVEKAYPDMTPKQLSRVFFPQPRNPNYRFFRNKESILVDPYSARVSSPQIFSSYFYQQTEQLHYHLMTGSKGLLANGVLSFFALVLLLSGLWLWWPPTIRQLKIRLSVKRKSSTRRLVMDLHNVIGIYLFFLLLITTATAMVIVYDIVSDGAVKKTVDGTHQQQKSKLYSVMPRGERLADDTLLGEIKRQYPDIIIRGINRPLQPEDIYNVSFEQKGARIMRGGSLKVDPYTGKILEIKRASSASTGQKTMLVVYALHDGSFGGVGIQILYTLTGLMPLGLFITGLLMWWKRKQAEWKAKRRQRRQVLLQGSPKNLNT